MTKNSSSRTHQPMQLDGGRLGKVEFLWTGDRYQHVWTFPGAGEAAQLSSIESTADAIWPASPPLQQVHLQSFDDGREVVFGLGMSGRGHWSASFTMVPELKGWIVEFACRSPLLPERLGCVYSRGSDWKETNHVFHCNVGETNYMLEAIAPTTLAALRDELHLAPATLPTATPATTQWAYRLKIV